MDRNTLWSYTAPPLKPANGERAAVSPGTPTPVATGSSRPIVARVFTTADSHLDDNDRALRERFFTWNRK